MTRKVADAVLGKLSRMYAEVIRRLGTGTLDPNRVVRAFQIVIENRDDFSAPKIGAGTRFIRMTAPRGVIGDKLPSNIVIEFCEMPDTGLSPLSKQVKQAEATELVEGLWASLPYSILEEIRLIFNEKMDN